VVGVEAVLAVGVAQVVDVVLEFAERTLPNGDGSRWRISFERRLLVSTQ